MVFVTVAGLVVASLALVGALGLSIYQRKSEGYRRWAAISFILEDSDEADLDVIELFLRLRETELLLAKGSDQ